MTTFLGETEHHQWWNLFALEEKGKLLFIIPMQWPDKFTFAQLLIDLGAKRGDRGKNHEDRVFKLSLFLDMSHLGPVRVDASVVEQAIRVSFLVSNESIQSFLNQYTPGLQQQLERHGFSLQQVTCRLEERASLAATSLADAIIDSEEHTISLIV
jgi:virulence-associated protein VapD